MKAQRRWLLPIYFVLQVFSARLSRTLLTMSRAVLVGFVREYNLSSLNVGNVNSRVFVGVKVPFNYLLSRTGLLALGVAGHDEVCLRLIVDDL